MNVVVSLGGSVLAPDGAGPPGVDRVDAHAAAVESLSAAGHDLGVVVGGGGVARSYIERARELGANEIALDEVGIAATRLNARLLVAALGDRAAPSPPEDYESAGAAMRRGEVPVMGGVAPGQTTDAVSAALAEYVGADLLVLATSVDGVYDADPDVDPDATKYDRLTPAQLVDAIAGMAMHAGASAPMDLLAAKLVERSGLRTVVLDGSDPARIERAVAGGDHDGTDVVPEDAADPTEWTTDAA